MGAFLPKRLDLPAVPGSTLAFTVTKKSAETGAAADLTGFSADLTVAADPAVPGGPPAVKIALTSLAGGGITLGGAVGTIAVAIPAPADLAPGRYRWVLSITPPAGAAQALLVGLYVVSPGPRAGRLP